MKRFFASCVCLILLALPVRAEETIVKFLSDVTVLPDASLDVVETIAVLADGSTIRHGIFRDFQTQYKDQSGIAMRVGFEVESVTRNGASEPFVVESITNGKRIKIGSKDVLIVPGIHKYRITYHTTRQIGFFESYDELYWNVTGNGWPYAIQAAQINIHLPSGAVISKSALYTGAYGTSGHDGEISSASGAEFEARATRILNPQEGLTVAVAWQKGIVAAPSPQQQQMWMLRDNAGLGVLVATVLGVLGYFFWAWNKVGRDPQGGTIIPLFKPPENLGPAGVRYIWKRAFDDRTMAAALVGLAVQGKLKIENNDGDYVIIKQPEKIAELSGTEEAFYKLLPAGRTELLKANNASIRTMKSGLEGQLEKLHKGTMFLGNLGWFAGGLLISILGLALSAFLSPDEASFVGLFAGVFIVIFWTIIFLFGWAVLKGLFSADGFWGKLKNFVGAIFIVPFAAIGLAILVGVIQGESLSGALSYFLIASVVIGFLNVLFYFLMPAPTVVGRRVLDAIEGFRLYMTTAEEKRLDLLNPPEKTPALFERYLPYAMALDCENAWNAKFASVLAAAAAAGAAGATWYYGSRSSDWGGMTKSLGSSLASTLSSASVTPGSSSGSGGGGFSGGGGGGGGGGGW